MAMPRLANFGQALLGGFERLQNGPSMPGLDQAEQDAARQRHQRQMMATLLQAGQPSTAPQSGLAAIGGAVQDAQQVKDQFGADTMRAKLYRAQIEQMARPRQAQERADPAALREMAALGFPMTQEGFAAYNKAKGSENPVADQLSALQAQLAIQSRQDQIERDRRTDAEAAEAKSRARAQSASAIKRTLSQTADIAALTEGLEDSFLGAGMPASSWRRTAAGAWSGIAGALGGDTSKIDADIGKFDKMKKGMSDQLINLISTGDLGDPTNAKLQSYQDALANTETSPPAIMSIQAGIAEAMIEAADNQGVQIEGRDKIEENIKKWRAYESKQGEPVIDIPAISKMSAAQLSELANSGVTFTKEMIDAAEARWNELNAN